MSDPNIGSLERKSAAFSIYVHSLDGYISEVVVGNHGTNATKVPVQISEAIQNSIRANIDYHDYMSDAHKHAGDSSLYEYHRVMASACSALKAN